MFCLHMVNYFLKSHFSEKGFASKQVGAPTLGWGGGEWVGNHTVPYGTMLVPFQCFFILRMRGWGGVKLTSQQPKKNNPTLPPDTYATIQFWRGSRPACCMSCALVPFGTIRTNKNPFFHFSIFHVFQNSKQFKFSIDQFSIFPKMFKKKIKCFPEIYYFSKNFLTFSNLFLIFSKMFPNFG